MRSQIRNIRQVYKFGAFGDPNSMGVWIYGKRPDGRTVACQSQLKDGVGISIWSFTTKGNEMLQCATDFSCDEWAEISAASADEQPQISNKIIAARMANRETK